jgi:hypothetical protein
VFQRIEFPVPDGWERVRAELTKGLDALGMRHSQPGLILPWTCDQGGAETPMEPLARELKAALREHRNLLFEAARETYGSLPNPGIIRYGDEDLRRVLAGFETLLIEALEGRSEAMELFLETAIPALVANGRRVPDLMHTVATFSVLFSFQLNGLLPEPLRAQASRFLATFFGHYAERVAVAARQAEREQT